MKCSICQKEIPDPCQAHYLDGPVCMSCLVDDFTDGIWRHQQGLMIDALDDTDRLWSNMGEW